MFYVLLYVVDLLVILTVRSKLLSRKGNDCCNSVFRFFWRSILNRREDTLCHGYFHNLSLCWFGKYFSQPNIFGVRVYKE